MTKYKNCQGNAAGEHNRFDLFNYMCVFMHVCVYRYEYADELQ